MALPNLRLSSAVLGGLAKPDFANVVGAGIGQAMLGPQRRKEKEETDAFYEQLIKASQEGNSETVGSLLAGRGAKTEDTSMVLQGMGMMTAAQKQKGLATIDGFMDVYADPTRSVEERNKALAQAESLAYSNTVGMTPQSFNAFVASATARHENTLNSQAKAMVSSDPQNAISRYTELYGQAEAWRVQDAYKNQTATKAAINNQSVQAFVASKQGEIARVETSIAQFQNVPVEQWDMNQLNELYKQRFDIEQSIVDRGGQGDPSKFIGGAQTFYDAAYKIQSDRKAVAQQEIDNRIESQMAQLHLFGANQQRLTSSQFVEMVREQSQNAPVNLYANWDQEDWESLEKKINSSQEISRSRGEAIKKGTLSTNQEEWLTKYSTYFSDDDEFNEALKTYRSDSSDNLAKLNAGNILTTKITAAQDQQRKDRRSDKRIKQRATDFVDAFLGAGDPDDPRYNPNIPVEGAFMQGDSVYDVIRRLKLTGDDRYNSLVDRVGNKIKDNPQADMRTTVVEAFRELYIRTPGEKGVQARQAQIDQMVQENKVGIAKRQKEHKKQTGEDISEEEAAMLIQQDMARMLAADAERMSAGINAVRAQTRPPGPYDQLPEATRGMDPVTAEEFFGGVGDVAGAGFRAFPGGPPSRGK